MANNKILTPPPSNTEIVDQGNNVSIPWSAWFNDLQYILSNRNHQTVIGAQPINLDSRFVDLKTSSDSGSYNITLDAPTVNGIIKTICMTVRETGTDITLAMTNIIDTANPGATSAVWDGVYETLELVSVNNKWLILNNLNVTIT